MFILRRTIRNFAISFVCALWGMSPVWADDTEIFFGDFSDGEISPNVLFVIDTSGSMGSNVYDADGVNIGTRMENVKTAMRTLLTSLSDVNVGLMRFSNPGGPVLYQVDYIDRDLNASTGGLIDVTNSVVAGNDDAQEVMSTGAMNLDSDRLSMVSQTVGVTLMTYDNDINDDDDDAEERANTGAMNLYSSDLELMHESELTSNLQLIGMRWDGVSVPPGATIVNAYIRFTMEDGKNHDGPIDVLIRGQKKDSGGGFTTATGNISKRLKTAAEGGYGEGGTDAAVRWQTSTYYAGNQKFVTPDISSVIQEIVDHPLWGGAGSGAEDDVLLILYETPASEGGTQPTGRYETDSSDVNSGEPELYIQYYTGPPPSVERSLTGVRFEDVRVPQGVTVTNAYLDFTVADTDAGEVTNLTIYGEDTDTPAAYSATDYDISTRTKTSASVNWNTIPTWDTLGETKTTPNLTSIVQEIVDRSDWCGGDDMAFIIQGAANGLRTAYSKDAGSNAPVLRIQYEEDSVIPGATCTLSSDDVREAGSFISVSEDEIDLISGSSIGLRYTGLALPETAVIKEAYLEIDPYNSWSGSTTFTIEAQDTGDAAPFTSADGTVDDRTWFSPAVTWNESTYWDAQGHYRSTDISSLMQKVVEHASWSTGNDVAFRLKRTSGNDRAIESYDYDPLSSAMLVVTFEDDGTESEVRLVRDELLAVIDTLQPQGATPLQDTLYEAALYYTGGEVDYGAYRGGSPYSYTRVSAAESMVDGTYVINRPSGCTEDDLGASACSGETITGAGGSNPTYRSPIDDWCQSNSHIIALTDGAANSDHSATKIADFIGGSCDNTGLSSGEYCVKDLVRYLNESDQSSLKETQRVTTHTIGFNFSSTWLRDVATAGGGQYKEATQAADLVTEIEQILTAVLKTNSSFVAPVAAINQFNRLNHRQEIYFAVFRPDEAPSWPGNIKKYRLRSTDNEVMDFSTDAGAVAIDPDTGFFTDTAESAWGGVADGKEVHISGAQSQMPLYSARNVYTYYDGSTSTNLTNVVNEVSTSNANLTKQMFGVPAYSAAELAEHIEWIIGKDVDDKDEDGVTAENRYILGDPLHSKPIAVTYGGTDANPDITVFFGTNTGFLHAVDSETGVEEFAFLPEAMYEQQDPLRVNSATQSHIYGIDGSVTPWVDDGGDGSIDGADGDFVRIYFGMRRGGRNYYALDVTDRDNPRIMWTIKGGQGDFPELGQTWSQPVLGTIDINGTETDVLYFAGGYDADQDDTLRRATDNQGRAIYIVNAVTGALIWSGGNGTEYTEDFDDMLYSIPGDLSVADLDSNGKDDMIFIGDMGGQVWRFDINNGAVLGDLVSGGVIADVGVAAGTNTAANNRRFYHGPDIALMHQGGQTRLALTIGSGFHAHPLSTGTTDRFYMIRQTDVWGAPTSYTKLTEADLYDATDNDVGEGVTGAAAALAGKSGWYFDMPRTGEKVLSTPLTFKNTATFTTYEPNPNSVTSNCIPAAGVTRVYQVSLDDASPINEWDDVTGLTEDDRATVLQSSSIIDEPVIVCTGAGCDMFVGAEKPPVDTPNTDRVVKTFWRKEN
jgi:type IV pilus assembly protein PilY1